MKQGTWISAAVAAAVLGLANSALAGKVVVTGHDPDFHAHAGSDTAGARSFIQKSVKWVVDGASDPKILVIGSLTAPVGQSSDGVLGIQDALDGDVTLDGAVVDLADGGFHPGGTMVIKGGNNYFVVEDLLTVDFSDYQLIIVQSNFGGWYTNAEEAKLLLRQADLVNFINGSVGVGLIAFAEGNHVEFIGTARELQDPYGFLPVPVSDVGEHNEEESYEVAPYGAAELGLVLADINGNFSHVVFANPGGYHVVDTLPGGVTGGVDQNGDPVFLLDSIVTLASVNVPDGEPPEPCVFRSVECGVTFGALNETLSWFQYDQNDKKSQFMKVVGGTSEIAGIVAIAGNDRFDGTQGQIIGNLLIDSANGATAAVKQGFFISGGAPIPTALNAAEAAAKTASNVAWALPGTDIGSIKAKKDGTYELTGANVCNVYAVKDIDLKQGTTMTLHGGPTTFFIFNISGNVKIEKSNLVLDGVLHNHILWNMGPTNKKGADLKWSNWAGTWVTQQSVFNMLRSSLDGAVFTGASSKCRWSQVGCSELE